MNLNKRTMSELVAEIEEQLTARGQSANTISQYHYIFQVFLAYFNSYNESYFSRKLMESCLREHYGIGDQSILSRRQHYKKKVIRASLMLEDFAESRYFSDRYYNTKASILTEDFSMCIAKFATHLREINRSSKTIDSYQKNVLRFLDFV